jgi:hypothetical protein
VLIRIDTSSFNRQNLDNYYVGYKFHSIDQIKLLKGLLQSMVNVVPACFTRTPTGKKIIAAAAYRTNKHASNLQSWVDAWIA